MRVIGYVSCIALTWVLASAGAEAAFRLLGDRPSLDLEGLYEPFGDRMYKLRDNVSTAADWASGHLTVRTDSLGLRCDDARRLATRPGDSVDVVFLGDSQGFGNGLSFDDTLAGATANAAAGEGYKAVNASVGGHSAATQLVLAEWLRNEQRVKTRTYVLLATPAIVQGGGHLTHATVGPDGRLYDRDAGALARSRVWIKTHLVTYGRLRDAARNSGIGIEPARDTPMVFGFYQTGAAEDRLHRTFSEFIGRLSGFAAQQDARVVIAYVPLTLETDFGPIQSAAAAQGIAIDRDVPLRVCRAAAERFGLPFVDLRPVLERLRAAGGHLHLRGDFHYDRETSKACADTLWASVRPAVSRVHLASSN